MLRTTDYLHLSLKPAMLISKPSNHHPENNIKADEGVEPFIIYRASREWMKMLFSPHPQAHYFYF